MKKAKDIFKENLMLIIIIFSIVISLIFWKSCFELYKLRQDNQFNKSGILVLTEDSIYYYNPYLKDDSIRIGFKAYFNKESEKDVYFFKDINKLKIYQDSIILHELLLKNGEYVKIKFY